MANSHSSAPLTPSEYVAERYDDDPSSQSSYDLKGWLSATGENAGIFSSHLSATGEEQEKGEAGDDEDQT
ncbi:hypothetical protein COCNU_scaffold007982G000010 [Cocos nucifera]|nr:hypothetical protein [Cocos nucifera]